MDDVKKVINLREQIFSAPDLKEEIIEVPEWGGVRIKLKGLTALEGEELLAETMDSGGKVKKNHLLVRTLIKSARNPETDKYLFGDEDMEKLLGKAWGVTNRLALKVQELSGINPGSVEYIEKNL